MGNVNSDYVELAEDLILKLKNFPELDIGDRKGSTDYIDFIKMEEVTSPVMQGKDCYGRHFMVIKLILNNKNVILQTFFQRYSDNLGDWRGCGHATQIIVGSGNNIDENMFKFINDLLDNKKIKINEEHNIDSCYHGVEVQIFDEEKWNAAIKIQNHWRLCRWDPKFKMCERVQLRALKEIIDEFSNKNINNSIKV